MSSEVKRYDPINSDGTCGICVEDADYGAYVEYADYAALEAENARLVREAKNDAIAYKAVLERQDELRAERDSALAQLAAIQGGMGEVVELAKDEQSKSEYWAAAESKAFSIEVPTEVWRAGYAAGCQRITAAMAAEVERLKAEVTRWHTLACNHSRAEDQLRAELAEVKGRYK